MFSNQTRYPGKPDGLLIAQAPQPVAPAKPADQKSKDDPANAPESGDKLPDQQ
ncbi:hypothetical protein ACL2XQ_22550 [Sodalis sp. RH14]|uniref:hypothetical protein n=1 Tax=Sodalis sp. RH14 TaxID=3394329 RepID=UPI0039B58126